MEVPTHVNALIDFAGSASATATFSFDSPIRRQTIEIIGTEGALSLPDPNTFDGPLLARGPHDAEWRELPVTGTTAGRGLGRPGHGQVAAHRDPAPGLGRARPARTWRS